MSSQGLKHAIHSRHKYWHEHAHHDTRHVVTQLEDTTWPSSDALKDDGKEKKGEAGGGGEEGGRKRGLESTAASGMKVEKEEVAVAVERRAREGYDPACLAVYSVSML